MNSRGFRKPAVLLSIPRLKKPRLLFDDENAFLPPFLKGGNPVLRVSMLFSAKSKSQSAIEFIMHSVFMIKGFMAKRYHFLQ
jgi:hypothetical protein